VRNAAGNNDNYYFITRTASRTSWIGGAETIKIGNMWSRAIRTIRRQSELMRYEQAPWHSRRLIGQTGGGRARLDLLTCKSTLFSRANCIWSTRTRPNQQRAANERPASDVSGVRKNPLADSDPLPCNDITYCTIHKIVILPSLENTPTVLWTVRRWPSGVPRVSFFEGVLIN